MRRAERGSMDFFVYSRDAAGSETLRDDDKLLEAHWSYMDRFGESMIARGPTLSPDRERATGSLHVLGLASVDAAREFVAREPNNLAGLYAEHSVWRFENVLGRTMWEFSVAADEPRFLILDHRESGAVPPEGLSAELRERLILYGALTTLDTADPAGVALAMQARDSDTANGLIAEGYPGLGIPAEIHHWEFGGRR